MENLMNKVANDLQNYAPQAPYGMEDRIQKALSKKKSFWSFSWYTMNVYVVGLLGLGAMALMLSNRNSQFVGSQASLTTEKSEVSVQSDIQSANNNELPIVKYTSIEPAKSITAKVYPTKEISEIQSEVVPNTSEVSSEIAIEIQPEVEVAETIELKKMPEEIQVPSTKTESVKPKGRMLKLTRLTGK